MTKIKIKGKMFAISGNKNITYNGKPITNEEAERVLNNKYKKEL